jgi:hypothetical protein
LIEGSVLSEDFELPSLRYKGKPFICMDKSRLILRLPPAQFDAALDIPGSLFFNPSENEKPKAGWVQIPYRQREHWKALSEIAADFIKE